MALLNHGSFYLSIVSIAFYVLLSGGYHSTAVTMIENVANDSQETEKMISAWNLYSSMCHSVSPILFGVLATFFNAKANPAIYGKLLIAFVLGGYLPAGILFWKGGQSYRKVMLDRDEAANLAPN